MALYTYIVMLHIYLMARYFESAESAREIEEVRLYGRRVCVCVNRRIIDVAKYVLYRITA